MRNFRIRLEYKHNKLQEGKWGKKGKYIPFIGNEIPSIKDTGEKTQKIYVGDRVKYINKKKPDHPNNGLIAVVTKVHKPSKMKDKMKAYEADKRFLESPLKEKMYDISFSPDEDEMEERRLNLTEGNKRSTLKLNMDFVEGAKLKLQQQKKIIVSVKSDELDKFNSNKDKQNLITSKVGELFNVMFKSGTEMKPKYVDKDNSKYESWEQWKDANSLLPRNTQKVLEQKGDIVVLANKGEEEKEKTFESPKKNYKINSFKIRKIDFRDVDFEFKEIFPENLLNEFKDKIIRDGNSRYKKKVKSKLNSLIKNADKKIDSDTQLFTFLNFKKFNLIRTNKKKWFEFLLEEFVLNSIFYEKDSENYKSKYVESRKKKMYNKLISIFDKNDFDKKTIFEQLFIIDKIISDKETNSILKSVFVKNNDNYNKELENIFKKMVDSTFEMNNTYNIYIKIRFYLQAEDDFGGRFGISSKCTKVFDDIKLQFSDLFKKIRNKKGGRKTKKYLFKKKRTKSLFKKKRTKRKMKRKMKRKTQRGRRSSRKRKKRKTRR